jgi:hypothetical protein
MDVLPCSAVRICPQMTTLASFGFRNHLGVPARCILASIPDAAVAELAGKVANVRIAVRVEGQGRPPQNRGSGRHTLKVPAGGILVDVFDLLPPMAGKSSCRPSSQPVSAVVVVWSKGVGIDLTR